MSKNYALKAQPRDRAGKGIARSLRRNNQTPAVIYGDKKEPIKIAVDTNSVNVEYNRGQMYTTLCDLEVGKDKHLVLARDVQLHPVTDNVDHIDFLRVTKKTKIAVNVPVHFINEEDSPGIVEKAVLNIVRFNVELMCSALEIPDLIEADLTGKNTGDSIRISDVKLPEGTTPVIDDRDFTLATLTAPKTMEELEADLDSPVEDENAAAEDDEESAEGDAEGEEDGDKPAE